MSKAVTGCGGCGCLLGLLALVAGVVMIGWGMTDSKVTELVMPGYAATGSGFVIAFLGLIILIVGIVLGRRKKGDDDEDE